MILSPIPKKWEKQEQVVQISDKLWREVSRIPDKESRLRLERRYPEEISFRQTEEIAPEGYHLLISEQEGKASIEIEAGDEAGCYYALITLRQLAIQSEEQTLPCCRIEDAPDIPVRGVMVDISRNKIPTVQTLCRIVDVLATMKLNHMELYQEGFSFAYPSFEDVWRAKEDNIPLTGEEIQIVDAYCREHFIDLTPNQNCLGHMAAWLEPGAFPELAENPEGGNLLGRKSKPNTLDPSDPGSLKLVRQMTDDLLVNFTSDNFNVDMDEPFDLGQGKNKERAGKEGVGMVYLDYMKKIYEMVTEKGKHMLVWGDILTKHPETLPLVPKDITVLDWHYEAKPSFEEHAKLLADTGIEFYLCPGTSAWTTFTGRTNNMIGNIQDAAVMGKKYGAKGVLITDWGDMGHMNPLPVSYAGYVYGGAVTWNTEDDAAQLAKVLDTFVYEDKAGVIGEASLQLGRYNQFEEYPMMNMTMASTLFFLMGQKEDLYAATKNLIYGFISFSGTPEEQEERKKYADSIYGTYEYDKLIAFLDQIEADFAKADIGCVDGKLVAEEFLYGIKIVRLCSSIRYYWLKGEPVTAKEKELLQEVIQRLTDTWLARNKERGLADTLAMLRGLEKEL